MDIETSNEQEIAQKNLKDRVILPIILPICAVGIVALLGISFSRIFLAGANPGEGAEQVADQVSKSTASVMWAAIITIVVLFGAAGISLMKSMRAASFTLIVSGVVLAIVLSGSILTGAGDVKAANTNFGEPTPAELASADPNNAVTIDALGTNLFAQTEFSATTGVVNIRYVGVGGTHRLKFDGDPRFNWFDLSVNAGSEQDQSVVLEPGKYVVFCPIPGHEKMRATITVK